MRTLAFVLALALGAAGGARAQALPQRWILAGDSIQTGVFPNEEFGLRSGDAADLTASLIQVETGVVIQNFSVPGGTMARLPLPPGAPIPFFPGLSDQLPAFGYLNGIFPVSGVILTIGVNDANTQAITPSAFQAAYASIVSAFRAPKDLNGNPLPPRPVVCVLPLNEPGETFASRRFQFQLAVALTCQAAGAPVFNPFDVGVFPSDDPSKRRLFSSVRKADGTFDQDPIHLSQAGHRLFATGLIDFMVARGFWTRR